MSEFTFRELETAHKKAFQNEPLVNIAKDCACFGCLEHFPPSAITDWVDDKIHRTAICPKCHIDTVLTEEVLDRVPDNLLKELQNEYCSAVSLPPRFDFLNGGFEALLEAREKEKQIRLFESDLIHADRDEKAKK
jgi:hypothetical protein